MKHHLFNRDSNISILIAGILTLVVGVGVARFAFTSLLPEMLEGYLSVSEAGVLASINFVGYLTGAIYAISIERLSTKVRMVRIGLILSVLTTLVLALSDSELLWILSRIVAGFGTAMLLIVGGSLVMVKLDYADKTKAMGIHFSGAGVSIVACELISRQLVSWWDWRVAWLGLTVTAVLATLYCFPVLSLDKATQQQGERHKFSWGIFTPRVLLLIATYLTAGVGFVVQATFLPDIINSLEGLDGYGNLGWLIVGLAGIPSSILWMRLAHQIGSIKTIRIAMVLHIVGILIPALTNSIALNLLSAALYGATFIGLVALFMNLGGQIAGKNPVVLMGAMTAAYGVGQVSAPLYSVLLFEHFGSYSAALFVTAAVVGIGLLFLALSERCAATSRR